MGRGYANDVESAASEAGENAGRGELRDPARNGWLKMGTVAAASAVLGGLAAAWFYRKTLSRLREAENEIPETEARATEDATGGDF